jgi:hypothetical protein
VQLFFITNITTPAVITSKASNALLSAAKGDVLFLDIFTVTDAD